MIAFFCYNSYNPAVYDEHSAGSAGSHLAVKGCSVNTYAPLCCLTDGVLFRMDGSHAVLGNASVFMLNFFKLVPYIIAVRKAGRSSYIAGNKNLVIACNNTA